LRGLRKLVRICCAALETRFISDASLARNYFDRVVNFRKGYLDVLAIGYTNHKQ